MIAALYDLFRLLSSLMMDVFVLALIFSGEYRRLSGWSLGAFYGVMLFLAFEMIAHIAVGVERWLS